MAKRRAGDPAGEGEQEPLVYTWAEIEAKLEGAEPRTDDDVPFRFTKKVPLQRD